MKTDSLRKKNRSCQDKFCECGNPATRYSTSYSDYVCAHCLKLDAEHFFNEHRKHSNQYAPIHTNAV